MAAATSCFRLDNSWIKARGKTKTKKKKEKKKEEEREKEEREETLEKKYMTSKCLVHYYRNNDVCRAQENS